MSDAIITVENLGKRYQLGQRSSARYTALRDVLTEKAQGLFRRGQNGKRDKADNEIWALREVSFEVKRGEVIGIIGRNGAGKSTLLKILSRITEPTTGRVRLRGRVASLLEVGTGFHPELTGRENIYLNGAILGMQRLEIKAKFDEIVAFAEVEKFLDTPVKRYSSGMYVRLAFAVAAHLEPEILVVDEVLAVGDAEFQKKCLGKMETVARSEGRTILFVSHNLSQVAKLCTRAVLLKDGLVQKQGAVPEIIDEYLATSFLGLRGTETSTFLQAKDGSVTLESCRIFGDPPDQPLQTGKSAGVELTFRFERKMTNPGFIVSVRAFQGAELFRISTSPISGVYAGQCFGTVKCSVTLDELQLTGGLYVLAVGLSLPNIEYIIPITEVSKFEVLPSDYYGSGFAMSNAFGFMVAKHRWSIEHSSTQSSTAFSETNPL